MRVEEMQSRHTEEDDADFLNLNGLVSGSNLDDMPPYQQNKRPGGMI